MAFDLSARMVASSAVITAHHKVGVTIDDDIRIMAAENYLPLSFCLPEFHNDVSNDLVV
jgi:hypothetical protein